MWSLADLESVFQTLWEGHTSENFHLLKKKNSTDLALSGLSTQFKSNISITKLFRFRSMTRKLQIFTDFRLSGRGSCPESLPLDPPVYVVFTYHNRNLAAVDYGIGVHKVYVSYLPKKN